MKKGFSRRKFLLSALHGSSTLLIGGAVPTSLAYCSEAEKSDTKDNKKKKEKYGIALTGLGSYSRGQLAPALKETNHCHLTGLITGTPEKEIVWADKHNIPEKNIYNYDNIEEIANNDDIDIVYIVLPNSMHAEYAIKSAEAGKHVICEKPMTTKSSDAQRIIDACNKNNVRLSIGYRLHFDPFNLEMMRLGQQQVYGKVKEIEAGFGFENHYPYDWRKDDFLAGGGPLPDLGIYCIQACVYTMGEIPGTVKASHKHKDIKAFHSVESETEWTFSFPSGAVANCATSYTRSMSYLKVKAEKGNFELDPAFYYGGITGNTPKGSMKLENVNQQARQMDDFAEMIKNNSKTPVPGEMGHRDVELIEAIYKAAKRGEEVPVETTYKALHKV